MPDQTGQAEKAAEPRSAAGFYEAGLRHLDAGRHLDAQICCERALALQADHVDTLHLMGLLSHRSGQYDHAVEWLSRAIRQEPKPVFLTSLGHTLLSQGRHAEALQSFDKAVQLKPDDADLWRDLGNALVEVGRPAEAILGFQQTLKLDPRHFDAAHKAAMLLHQAGRYEEALASFILADDIKPDHFPTLHMRGLTLQNLRRFEAALAVNERAFALDRSSADTCNNIGNTMRALGRHEEALHWFDRSLQIRPDFAPTLGNKAVVLADLRRFDEAIACYQQALTSDPNHTVAAWNLGLLQMLTGDFAAGWAGREARWKLPAIADAYPKLSQPMWLGSEDIVGKTILVCADEGIGDTIQFVRYVPMLAARGARVILMVQDPLHRLLSGAAGIAQCLPRSAATLPPFDLHFPLASLPLVFATTLETIPATAPYLPSPPADRTEAWQGRLGAHDKMRVGLVWSGNPNHNNDRNRSIPLRELVSILDVDATFVSLQKDPRPEDKATLIERPEIVDLTTDLIDFAETAALLACLDLIITVDTSVAHLAGALGRPTWILLPYTPDYRWLLDRNDSPWYPTVRLFRQSEDRNYASVLGTVRAELNELRCRWRGPDISSPTNQPRPPSPGAERHHQTATVKQTRINRDLALARKTDRARWSDPSSLEAAWDARAALAAQFVPAGTRVLDLGCGKMSLARFLPQGCSYQGCDLVARDSRTIVCDFNAGEFPTEAARNTDMIVLLGVLEYIRDVEAFFAHLRSSKRDIVLSYCATDLSGPVDRASLGWITHFSFQDLAELFDRHGFRIKCSMPIDNLQVLIRLTPLDPLMAMAPCKVAVLSYNDAGNFGDRLGYHMINSLLPSEATVHHVTFRTLDRLRDRYDLVVLGIGNSLPLQLLHSDILLDIMKCGKAKVGIFGTQYRELFQPAVLHRLVDRLDFWFARYEDDVLMYGRDSTHVEHLGDWLIDQFPMSEPSEEVELQIGDEILQTLPLDRTIQQIQRHKKVRSTRLHPLLCALTSAEQVAYVEQLVDANNSSYASGKFRSMLIDIFGRTYPEKSFFAVDRDAVGRYKQRVHRNVASLGGRLEAILRNVAAAGS